MTISSMGGRILPDTRTIRRR